MIYIGYIFSLLVTFISQSYANNPYQQMQQIAGDALQVNGERMKNEAENMANSKTPGYVPKALPVTVKRDRKAGINRVMAKSPIRNSKQTKQVYNPHHPMADAQGMVMMPDVNPMVSLMNLQETKADNERVMKAYQMATDQRHRTLSMVNH